MVEGDEAFAIELLETFLEHTPAQMEQIRQSLETDDFLTIGRLIHAQKATIKLFGLTELTEVLLRLESRIKEHAPPAELRSLVEQYVVLIDVAMTDIRRFITQKISTPPPS